jgi:hypothetical protein
MNTALDVVKDWLCSLNFYDQEHLKQQIRDTNDFEELNDTLAWLSGNYGTPMDMKLPTLAYFIGQYGRKIEEYNRLEQPKLKVLPMGVVDIK